MITKLFLITILLSHVFARLEIEIEGEHGWATKLPTWRNRKTWFTTLTDKTLTGYHVWTWTLVLLMFHLPFVALRWTFQRELLVLGFISLFWVLEDFQWFLFNPHFGFNKFTKEDVSWHKKWLYGLPLEYYWGVGAFLVFLFLGSL